MVLAIIATLAAIAAPRYANSLAHYRVEMAARRILADLKYARLFAYIASSSQSVTFYPASDRYEMPAREDPDHPGSPYDVRLCDEPYHADLTSVSFVGGGDTVTFDGFGMPDRGGSVTLQAGNHTRSVLIDAETGRASIQ